jgi:hypothetical protein
MLAQSQRRMLTPAATAWIDEHLPADAIFWTDGVVIEHRFVAPIVARKDLASVDQARALACTPTE